MIEKGDKVIYNGNIYYVHCNCRPNCICLKIDFSQNYYDIQCHDINKLHLFDEELGEI